MNLIETYSNPVLTKMSHYEYIVCRKLGQKHSTAKSGCFCSFLLEKLSIELIRLGKETYSLKGQDTKIFLKRSILRD